MRQLPVDWQMVWITTGKLAVAYILALPAGWWSEKEGHAVGIRTFPIVTTATCGYLLLMLGNGGPDGMAATSRVLQGLVAGIGFVGGGAIVKDGMTVHGTATAASIWNAGAIGAAVALEKYEIAIVLAALNLFSLKALAPVKKRLDRPDDGNKP